MTIHMKKKTQNNETKVNVFKSTVPYKFCIENPNLQLNGKLYFKIISLNDR